MHATHRGECQDDHADDLQCTPVDQIAQSWNCDQLPLHPQMCWMWPLRIPDDLVGHRRFPHTVDWISTHKWTNLISDSEVSCQSIPMVVKLNPRGQPLITLVPWACLWFLLGLDLDEIYLHKYLCSWYLAGFSYVG